MVLLRMPPKRMRYKWTPSIEQRTLWTFAVEVSLSAAGHYKQVIDQIEMPHFMTERVQRMLTGKGHAVLASHSSDSSCPKARRERLSGLESLDVFGQFLLASNQRAADISMVKERYLPVRVSIKQGQGLPSQNRKV